MSRASPVHCRDEPKGCRQGRSFGLRTCSCDCEACTGTNPVAIEFAEMHAPGGRAHPGCPARGTGGCACSDLFAADAKARDAVAYAERARAEACKHACEGVSNPMAIRDLIVAAIEVSRSLPRVPESSELLALRRALMRLGSPY